MQPVANEQEIEVFVNNVRQEGGSGKAYTCLATRSRSVKTSPSSDTVYVNFAGQSSADG